MNDFTKEELEDLRNCVANYASQSDHNFGDCCYPVLLKKVGAMIENYCEHAEKETVIAFHGGTVYENRCKKCGSKC